MVGARIDRPFTCCRHPAPKLPRKESPMIRPLVATVLSAVLALGVVGTVPAHAENTDDLKRILGGVAAAIILGVTIDNLRDRNRRAAPTPDHDEPRHETGIVPSHCLRTADNRHGPQTYFAASCLRRTMQDAQRLPHACAVEVRRHGRPALGYDPRCLRDYGWRHG